MAVRTPDAVAQARGTEALPAAEIERVVRAAEEALKAGQLAAPVAAPSLSLKAQGYRIGASRIWIVPTQGPGDRGATEEPTLLAMVLTQGFTLGDYRTLVPVDEAGKLVPGEGRERLNAYFVVLRRREAGTRLEVYGAGREPLASVPVRRGRLVTNTPFLLQITSARTGELTFSHGGLVATLRVVAPER